MSRHLRGFLLSLSALALCGCGPSFEHARCKEGYDDCVNLCAPLCEGPGSVSPEAASATGEGATVNTWDMRCQECESSCRDGARKCDRERKFKGDTR